MRCVASPPLARLKRGLVAAKVTQKDHTEHTASHQSQKDALSSEEVSVVRVSASSSVNDTLVNNAEESRDD